MDILLVTKNPTIPKLESTFTEIFIGLEVPASALLDVVGVSNDSCHAEHISEFYFVHSGYILKWLIQNFSDRAVDRFWKAIKYADVVAIHKDVCEMMET